MTSLVGFKSALIGGGARPNQFSVTLTFPTIAADNMAGLAAPFLVKAASLPAIDIGVAPVFFHGRLVPLAGERTFNPWTITVYNDNNFLLRNAFERWSNAMNDFANNGGVTSPFAYKADMQVHQLDRNGVAVKTYKFVGAFPQAIGEIGLDFGDNDRVEDFPVTFAYEHYEAETGGLISGGVNIGGVGINF